MYYNIKNEKIYYMSAASESAPLNIFLAGITLPNPNYRIVHNTSLNDEFDRYQFEYVTKGCGHITINGQTTTVREGDFFFLNKNVTRTFFADSENPWEKMFITVNGPLIDGFISTYQMNDPLLVLHTNLYEQFQHILQLLQNEQLSSVTINELVAVELFKIILIINRGRQAKRAKNNLCQAEHILNFIDQNIYHKFTLDDIAAYFFLSKAQIIRIFQAKYQITPMQYAITKKIALAKYHLSKSNISISALSDMLNFSDSKHFAKLFKKYENKTPTEYRKEQFATQKITLENLSRDISK